MWIKKAYEIHFTMNAQDLNEKRIPSYLRGNEKPPEYRIVKCIILEMYQYRNPCIDMRDGFRLLNQYTKPHNSS